MPSDTAARAEHDRNVDERRRYRIVRPPGEVTGKSRGIQDMRNHTGDVTQEWYDDVLIREHILTVVMEEQFSAGGRPLGLQHTPKFETVWRIGDAERALLPKLIVDGRWSDPVAAYPGRWAPLTQPEGEWGVYGTKFTDAYTLGQIQPLEDRYNHLRTSMLSASNGLYVPEKYVNTVGLFDNLDVFVRDWQSKIAECNTKIETAQSILVSTGGASYTAGSPQQATTTVRAKLTQLSLLG
jgi:hypothetical protein